MSFFNSLPILFLFPVMAIFPKVPEHLTIKQHNSPAYQSATRPIRQNHNVFIIHHYWLAVKFLNACSKTKNLQLQNMIFIYKNGKIIMSKYVMSIFYQLLFGKCTGFTLMLKNWWLHSIAWISFGRSHLEDASSMILVISKSVNGTKSHHYQ